MKKAFNALEGYLYLAPTMIVLGIFVFWPIVSSFQMSLTRVAPFGGAVIDVGAEHYQRLWAELIERGDFYNNLKVSLLFTLATVPTGIGLAVVLAIALSYPLTHLSWFHRTLIFVPIVISSAITAVIFRWLYNPATGYVNYWISLVGIDSINWLTSKDWALVSVAFAVVWRQLGFNVIIALAGVQNIDSTYYEAAKVDGANLWHRVRHITLPLLSPTLFFLLIINVINSLQTFGEINILTDGGPGQATTNMIYAIFIDGFVGTPLRGFASAQAYILALVIIGITLVQFRGFGRKVHYS
ncbi:ABC transporter, permease protein 1 (cluster 1, maltose/g3p/polyamine/iron) [hydrothermal vent metagenome]|uniref:ABC transporter, permease protein 1 (Cluster 1, maltose/g3p/polyamine/iron) n=1 Tax=hydrothermal vent metagenome TaxID=652676 RepID=A0A3B0VHM3_9ZZZZ